MLINKFLKNINSLQKKERKEYGFVLPQILVLSIGLAIGITGLLAVSIRRVNTNRIALLEMQAKNAAESGVSTVKALLNNSKEGVLFYYWLAKSCSLLAKNTECYQPGVGADPRIWPGSPIQGIFPDLSRMYWTDTGGKWCDGVKGCIGRQIAPKCTYAGKGRVAGDIPWYFYSRGINKLLDRDKEKVGFDIPSAKTNHQQTFSLIATDYVGNEVNGTTGLLIEGFAQPKNSPNIDIASNKLRVEISVSRVVTPQAFGVISAGETEKDGENINGQSMYLKNFSIKGDKVGTIIWRKNISRVGDCSKLTSMVGISSRDGLPDNSKGMGGLFVQPILLPEKPSIKSSKGRINISSTFCYPENSKINQSKCNLLAESIKTFPTTERIVTIDDLFVYGKDGVFDIVTSDKSRIKLVVRGSIHVANEGLICHRDKTLNAKCGSGKPENLTIMFEQPGQNSLPNIGNLNGRQELACSADGGLMLRENKNIPFNSLIISNTGDNSEKFSGFIYGPQTTFSTTKSSAPYYQKPKSTLRNLVVLRGLYAFIDNPDGPSYDKSPRLLRSPNGKLIPFQVDNNNVWDNYMRNKEIIALGRKIGIPPTTHYDNVALIWDNKNNTFLLWGIDLKTQNISGSNISIEGKLVDPNVQGGLIQLGSNPYTLVPNGNSWLSYYGIELIQNKTNLDRNFEAIAWMKNFCLDNQGKVNWEFNKNFNKNLVERFAKIDFNYGVPYYRGQSIKVWDTLRSFN